jgi:dTDP-4-dehydrorhamnose 3,5-epimerase-like enzyme
MHVITRQINVHRNKRGMVFEPLDPQRIAGQRNVHVVVSEPGAVRGNHRHENGTEIITLCGPAKALFKVDENINEVIIPMLEVIQFTIPPGVAHAFINTGESPSVLVAFNTEEHDPENPDVVHEILIEE